ncbi:NAD-dependent epimerase [Paractinoplanes abujensis]|uniref:Nucleoside-diphosphate-sugar epimerase n=1 Tax=Paractinoplanes abujensis TaxID=882441 RepID=A0A7W7CS15_9ACTN|nr:NAD(P)-dependent oxidoreductase [Actinoplanes abujensis]MBB4693689.1 nucleoside-diphosphate-sugar epimerase [Actinoplanes abujensis]GID21654.1 NAD-dependent epimerase [Actinoplanes abujensis]
MDDERLVAVTGSSGRVGEAVARGLATAGWRVRGGDRAPGPCTQVVGDLRDPRVRQDLVRGAAVVVHAAALHAPHVGVMDDAEFRAVNVDATEALLADAAGGRRFVYISSTSVYGSALVPVDRAVWVDEALAPQPRDIYDETKLAAERLVAAGPLPSVVLRIARCFPEPLPVLATRLLHRAVRLEDVVAAVTGVLTHGTVTGTFTIAGRYPFRRDDCVALHHDAAGLIAVRAPDVAAAFRARGWPLPARLDRVYDSGAATDAFGYRPAEGVLSLLRGE